MLINFSSHPSQKWSAEQLSQARKQFGGVTDLKFPNVNPNCTENDISKLTNIFYNKILKIAQNIKKTEEVTVHIMGERTLTFTILTRLLSTGIPCVASCTQKEIVENANGRKESVVKFVRFRYYLPYIQPKEEIHGKTEVTKFAAEPVRALKRDGADLDSLNRNQGVPVREQQTEDSTQDVAPKKNSNFTETVCPKIQAPVIKGKIDLDTLKCDTRPIKKSTQQPISTPLPTPNPVLPTNLKDIQLTAQQNEALDKIKRFINDDSKRIFILKGFAGTGKTTLTRFLLEHLKKEQIDVALMAPTGRAAKILSNLSNYAAATIHSNIYKLNNLNKDLPEEKLEELTADQTGQLYLTFYPTQTTFDDQYNGKIYIVDEASMISDKEDLLITQAKFGSGKLLTELLEYDKHPKSKFIFIGDPCQLPPIRGLESPALSSSYLQKHFNCDVDEFSLTEIMRQADDGDLITATKKIRELRENAPLVEDPFSDSWARLPLRDCKETHLYPDTDSMLEKHIELIRNNGYNDSIFICGSNRKRNQYSALIRKSLGFSSNQVQKGDLLMVIQNNQPTGLLNGDMVEVLRVDPLRTYRANCSFINIHIRELFTKQEHNVLLMEQPLNLNSLNIDSNMQTNLFIDFAKRMANKGITQQKHPKEFQKALMDDPYLNALRCHYGYAVTCHKAQGGEWNNVFIDFGIMVKNPTKEKYQWIYTAVTRARTGLHVLDKPYICNADGSSNFNYYRRIFIIS